MTRIRWLEAEWELSLRQMAVALRAAQFSRDSLEGFVVDRVRRDSIEARYIQRIEATDVVIDPFGNESVFTSLSFNEQSFIISGARPCLELRGGARSLQALFSLLSQVTDFRFAVKSINVDVDRWLANFVLTASGNYSVDAFQVGNIAFPDGSIGRAIVRSRRGDARAAIMEMVSGKSYVIEKARIRPEHSKKGSILMSSSCSLMIQGFSVHEETILVESLRDALREVIG